MRCKQKSGLPGKGNDMRQASAGRPGAHRWRRQRGLTLIELLVVLLILALIAAFAVPRVLNYLGGARHDAAAAAPLEQRIEAARPGARRARCARRRAAMPCRGC